MVVNKKSFLPEKEIENIPNFIGMFFFTRTGEQPIKDDQ
jgi:hypothetical protein